MDKFIGLIGLGYWGKNILRNLYELNVLRSACDFDKRVIEERRKDFPDVNYTQKIEDISVVLQDCKIWQFTDGYAGITVCYADNMERARKYISAARDVDKDADVMIIYDYIFK